MVAERSGWASLLPDLLELVFRVLDSRDLLVCASVCRSWRRHLNRDTRWLPHLAVRLGIDNETLQAQLHALPSLGVLSIKDLLFMACFEQRGKELFALAWFRNFPYHPLRHGALRLAWAYATHRRGLWATNRTHSTRGSHTWPLWRTARVASAMASTAPSALQSTQLSLC